MAIAHRVIDLERGPGQTRTAPSQVLSATKSLSTESSRVRVTVDSLLRSVHAA